MPWQALAACLGNHGGRMRPGAAWRSHAPDSTLVRTDGTPRWAPLRLEDGLRPLSDSPSRGSDYRGSLRGFSYPPQVIPPPNSPQTSLHTLDYHSPLEGESERSSRMAKADPVGGRRRRLPTAAPNGEGFCGGGFAQGEPTARSCAPSRVRTGQPTGEGRCGGRRSRPASPTTAGGCDPGRPSVHTPPVRR